MKESILLIFCTFLTLAMLPTIFAAECGGETQCNCGDTLTSSHTMDYDLINCSGDGLTISSDNIILDCNGHMIDSDGNGPDDSGLYLYQINNVILKIVI